MEEYFAQVGVYVLPSTDVWYDDTRFLIDRLTAIDAGTDQETVGTRDRFAGRLDLERLGVAGMSFGGSTAGVTCIRDRRCKAGVNIDGWQFGQILDHPLQFLFMSREGKSVPGVFRFLGRPAARRGARDDARELRRPGDRPVLPLDRTPQPGPPRHGTARSSSGSCPRYLLAFFSDTCSTCRRHCSMRRRRQDLRDATLTVVRPSTARPAPNAPSGPS
jgi:hypothetical protein